MQSVSPIVTCEPSRKGQLIAGAPQVFESP
jgi:hypothetical protein